MYAYAKFPNIVYIFEDACKIVFFWKTVSLSDSLTAHGDIFRI